MAIGDESTDTSLSPSSPIQLSTTSTILTLDEESAPYSPLSGGNRINVGGGNGKKKLESVRNHHPLPSSYGGLDSSSPERKGILRGGFKMPGGGQQKT
jgi:hypothetical protein